MNPSSVLAQQDTPGIEFHDAACCLGGLGYGVQRTLMEPTLASRKPVMVAARSIRLRAWAPFLSPSLAEVFGHLLNVSAPLVHQINHLS